MTGSQIHNVECACSRDDMSLLSVEEARKLALKLVVPLTGTELLPLAASLGRVLSKDLRAPSAMPFFDNSAMDGYAVSTQALIGEPPWQLPVSGTVAAGDGLKQVDPVQTRAYATRIFTGAPVAAAFDAVIPQEDVAARNGAVTISRRPQIGSNIRYAGSDMERGALLVGAGTNLTPHHIGLLAANGYSSVNVVQLPRIALFSTGDELARPGERAEPGQIYDSNKSMLMALSAELGLFADDLGALPDDLLTTQALMSDCRNRYDLLISTGSVSVGERDFLQSAFLAAGGSVKNWKVAVKPGKPVLFGKLGNTIFTGLPGNPFAAFVGFHLFVKPQIQRLRAENPKSGFEETAIADFSWSRKPGRLEVFPVTVSACSTSGLPEVSRLGNSVSATLYPLANADGLAQVPADCAEVRPGDRISWQQFKT